MSSDEARRLVAVSLPVILPPAMTATFAIARARLGEGRGYVAGFGIYWTTCAVACVAILGRRRLRELLRPPHHRLARPRPAIAFLLLWPPLGAITTRLVPEMGHATRSMVATIAGVATANAVCEELLWRGVYVSLWGHDPVRGWIWPALGFGAWHLAPQVIHSATLGTAAYVLAAEMLGLSWGWVAWRTSSLRWVCLSHVLTDGSGIRNARYFLAG